MPTLNKEFQDTCYVQPHSNLARVLKAYMVVEWFEYGFLMWVALVSLLTLFGGVFYFLWELTITLIGYVLFWLVAEAYEKHRGSRIATVLLSIAKIVFALSVIIMIAIDPFYTFTTPVATYGGSVLLNIGAVIGFAVILTSESLISLCYIEYTIRNVYSHCDVISVNFTYSYEYD